MNSLQLPSRKPEQYFESQIHTKYTYTSASVHVSQVLYCKTAEKEKKIWIFLCKKKGKTKMKFYEELWTQRCSQHILKKPSQAQVIQVKIKKKLVSTCPLVP